MNNGIIKYIYFIPKSSHVSKSLIKTKSKNPSYQSKENRNNNDLKNNLYKQSDIENVFKQKIIPSDLSKTNNHQIKWVYHEGYRTEITSCDKICNGIQRIQVYPVCMNNNNNKVDEKLCPSEKLKPKLVLRPCNTDCKLKYEIVYLFLLIKLLITYKLVF